MCSSTAARAVKNCYCYSSRSSRELASYTLGDGMTNYTKGGTTIADNNPAVLTRAASTAAMHQRLLALSKYHTLVLHSMLYSADTTNIYRTIDN
jgi:hypothetical protein